MTHDLKFDVPALQLALGSNAGFIGAIGSEKTRADRTARLREAGIGDADLARLHAPVGIQIGARTPGGGRGDDRGAADRGERGRARRTHRDDLARQRSRLRPGPRPGVVGLRVR